MDKINNNRMPIDLEVIETPKGKVPTVNSFNSIITALNILDNEITNLKGSLLEELSVLTREIKSIKKLMLDEVITLDSLKEFMNITNDKLESLNKNSNVEDLKKIISELKNMVNELKADQANMRASFVKALESLAKVVDVKLSKE